MRSKLLRLIAGLSACLYAFALSAATLLPPGMQTFVDGNGAPLVGGSLSFYVPNSTTPKDTWQDPAATILNTNPVILDSSGRAVVFGTGSYREVLQDQYGNVVWDKITGDPGASNASWGGIGGGTGNAQTVTAANFSSQDGQSISYIPSVGNTGPASLTPNGAGAIAILLDTPTGPVGLSGGEITANTVATVTYDASRGAFHLTGTETPQPGTRTQIAAASTTDLGTVASHFAYVVYSNSISSFGSSCVPSAPIYYVVFSGGQTIVGSSTLMTPGNATISAYPNDSAVLECLGGGNWQVLSYNSSASLPVPSGAVMAFNLGFCPGGWTQANGQNNTVDARGVAIRGLDAGKGLDPNRTLGSYEADALQNFGVTVNVPTTGGNVGTSSGGVQANAFAAGQTVQGVPSAPVTGQVNAGVAPSIATETRMKNVALLYCQKL